jgi:poly-gamma-glutamate synthesis protein (capsule biosynthesis protein)
MVDEDERNDLSFLFMLDVEKGRIRRISLHPVRIEDLGVRRANEQERQFLTRSMQAKCNAFGTTMDVEGQVGTIRMK